MQIIIRIKKTIKNKMRRYVRKAIKATKKAVNVPIKACENIIHTIKNDDKKKQDDAIAKFNEQQRNQNIQIENKNKEIEEESKKKKKI